MIIQFSQPGDDHGADARLAKLGLTVSDVHSALRRGASRASSRSGLAPKAAPGSDIYYDGMEDLADLLCGSGRDWTRVGVGGQPRLIHPDGRCGLTISSAKGAGQVLNGLAEPVTNRKGPSTRAALADPMEGAYPLFDMPVVERSREEMTRAQQAPLWFVLHERTEAGLFLEVSRPVAMVSSGLVTGWQERIILPFLDLDGDMSAFERPDKPEGEFDVPVEPR